MTNFNGPPTIPSNLIPKRITDLPPAPITATDGNFPIVIGGTLYQGQFQKFITNTQVPASRTVGTALPLTGGGNLTGDLLLGVAAQSIDTYFLKPTGTAAGNFGSETQVPVLQIGQDGRIYAASTATIDHVPGSTTLSTDGSLYGGGLLINNLTLGINYGVTSPLSLGAPTPGVSSLAARADHVHPALNLAISSQYTGNLPVSSGGTGFSANTGPGGYLLYKRVAPAASFEQLSNPSAQANPQSYVLTCNSGGDAFWQLGGSGAGTLQNVNVIVPPQFNSATNYDAPLRLTASVALAWNNQSPNLVLAGPAMSDSAAAAPTFRPLAVADLPTFGTAGTFGQPNRTLGLTIDSHGLVSTVTTSLISIAQSQIYSSGSWDPTVAIPWTSQVAVTGGVMDGVAIGSTTPVSLQASSMSLTSLPGGTQIIVANNRVFSSVSSLSTSLGGTGLNSPIGYLKYAGAATPTTYSSIPIADLQFNFVNLGNTQLVLGNTYGSLSAMTDITMNSTTPVSDASLVTKAYVDSVAQGLAAKESVHAATLTNITLSGLQTIDGYLVSAGERVLVKNQTDQTLNGIYTAAIGPWSRTTDMNSWNEFVGAFVFVQYHAGSTQTQGNTGWACNVQPGGTIGITPITWVQFSGAGTFVADGTSLVLTGNVFSIKDTTVTAGNYGSANSTLTLSVNTKGQLIAVSAGAIAINANQITNGTIAPSLVSGSYAGITGVGSLTSGSWNATTINVQYGGTGTSSITGYVKASGQSPFTASLTIPFADVVGAGTMASQNANNVSITGGLLSGTVTTPLTISGAARWQGQAIGVGFGGSGAATFTDGYLKASGTNPFTTVATIPNTDITGLGTMSTQNATNVSITGGNISGGTTWNAAIINVPQGGTGVGSLAAGYVRSNGGNAFTSVTTIPNTNITGLGTMSTQNANNVAITGGSMSGVAINSSVIGSMSPSAGSFTSLVSYGSVASNNSVVGVTAPCFMASGTNAAYAFDASGRTDTNIGQAVRFGRVELLSNTLLSTLRLGALEFDGSTIYMTYNQPGTNITTRRNVADLATPTEVLAFSIVFS